MKTDPTHCAGSVDCGVVTSREHVLWWYFTDHSLNVFKLVACVFPALTSWLLLVAYDVRFTAISLTSVLENDPPLPTPWKYTLFVLVYINLNWNEKSLL